MSNEEKIENLFHFYGLASDDRFTLEQLRCIMFDVANWKDQQISKEVNLIVDWFNHIAQIADDRKTLNGFVMQDSDALDEIKCLAKRSAEYVEKFLKK